MLNNHMKTGAKPTPETSYLFIYDVILLLLNYFNGSSIETRPGNSLLQFIVEL